MSSRYGLTRLDLRNSRVDRLRLSIKLLEVVSVGSIKCYQVVSSRYEWTRLDFTNSQVDRVRLSMKVLEVAVSASLQNEVNIAWLFVWMHSFVSCTRISLKCITCLHKFTE